MANAETITNEQIEYLDNLITKILNKATKHVEGPMRNTPHSKEKAKRSASIKHWKIKVRKLAGVLADEDELLKLRQFSETEDDTSCVNQAQSKLQEAKENWAKLIVEGKEHREKDIFYLYSNEISAEVLSDKKQKEKIIKSVIKNKSRRHAFKHITNHIGRGERRSLKKVHEAIDDNIIVRTHMSKEQIEDRIINCNREHCTQAHQTNIYQDKTHNKLQRDNKREKILNGNLSRQECDNKEAHEFLIYF